MPLSAIQSSSRAMSSSSSRKRRRTGSRSARSSTWEAVSRCAASSSSRAIDAEHRVRLAQRAVGEPDAQVRRAVLLRQRVELVVLVVGDLPRAEGRLDQRRERLDVRAHDDDVSWLERGVVGEQVQDRVADDLDLAGAAVAGVDLDAAVGRARVGGLVVADGGLEAGELAVGGVGDGVLVADDVGAEDELELPRVLAPGGEQAVLRPACGRVLCPELRPFVRLGDLAPERGRGVQEEQVDMRGARRVPSGRAAARRAGG